MSWNGFTVFLRSNGHFEFEVLKPYKWFNSVEMFQRTTQMFWQNLTTAQKSQLQKSTLWKFSLVGLAYNCMFYGQQFCHNSHEIPIYKNKEHT